MKKIIGLFTLLLTASTYSSDKVLIITHSFNRPDFIKIHHKTFKAFMQDDYEFVVFNDARDKQIRKTIRTTCHDLHIRCIEIPQEIHDRPYLERFVGENYNNANARCANVVQYSLDILGFNHNGIVMIIDSDMFLIKPFSLNKFMQDCDLYGNIQYRANNVTYLWNGLVFMDMRTLPNKTTMNFNCGRVNNEPVDVGGQLHHYLIQNPTIRLKYYSNTHLEDLPHNRTALKTMGYDKATIDFIIETDPHDPYSMEFHAENHFLHYRAGGNWTNQPESYHRRRTRALENFLEVIIK